MAGGGTPLPSAPDAERSIQPPGPPVLYLYPPPLAVLLAAVTSLATPTVEAGWWILRVGLLAVGCAAMPVPRWVRGAVLLLLAVSYPTLIDLNLGNVSLLVLVTSCLAWRWLDRPASGVATALAMALRPTLIVVPIWWLIRRRWQVVASTVGSGVLLIVLTLPFVGIGGYTDYLTVVRNLSNVTGVTHNVDLASAALLLGLGPGIVQPALIVQHGVGLGAFGLALPQSREVGFVMVTVASLLLAPLIWVHYLVVLALPAALLAARGHRWAVLLPLLGWLPEAACPWWRSRGRTCRCWLPVDRWGRVGRLIARMVRARAAGRRPGLRRGQRRPCLRGKQATTWLRPRPSSGVLPRQGPLREADRGSFGPPGR